MIGRRIFCDLSLSDFAELRRSGAVAINQLGHAMTEAHELTKQYQVWRAFDVGSLMERLENPYVPSPYSTNVIPDLWDVPFGAKDVFNSQEFGVEKGSKRWVGYRAGNDARAIENVRRSGGVLVGMSTTSEFAVDQESPVLNPHDITRTPGTSSAGSAVACALGIVPFSLGTQSGGSIIRPASFSGTIGMKPSFGLIPRTGVLKTSDSLDTVGFFTSRVDSLRPVLDALRVSGRDYPFVHSLVDPNGSINLVASALRVGVVKTPTWNQCRADVKAMIECLVQVVARVALVVEELDVDAITEDAHSMHDEIYNASLVYHLAEDFEANSQDFSRELHRRMEAGRYVTRNQYAAALGYQERMGAAINRVFHNFDLVISPATSAPAPLRGEQPVPDPSLIWTMAGIPAVSVPMGFTQEGLPIGVQIVAAKYSDYQLISSIEALAKGGVLASSSLPIEGVTD